MRRLWQMYVGMHFFSLLWRVCISPHRGALARGRRVAFFFFFALHCGPRAAAEDTRTHTWALTVSVVVSPPPLVDRVCIFYFSSYFLWSVAFAERWTLRVHERNVHEKLKPHTCPVCFKSFGEVWNRDKHVANLHRPPTARGGGRDPHDAGGRGEPPHSRPVGDAPLYDGEGVVRRGGDYGGGAGGGVPYGQPAFAEPVNPRGGGTHWM